MKFSIYGRKVVEVIRDGSGWSAFYLGNEGKKRKADGLVIPSTVREEDLVEYLADVFHEMATPANHEIKRL